jgi:HSP20 family protein
LSETDKEIKVAAKLPGFDDRDVDVQLSNSVLTISGEKKTESQDKDRLFTERYYGRFERRLPVEDVDEDKVSATFKKGLLTATLPKLAQAKSAVRRLTVQKNAFSAHSGG